MGIEKRIGMPIVDLEPITYSLTPYTGPWTKAEAGHLLRRTMFGPTNQQILDAEANGMATTLSSLLQIPALTPPLTFHPDEGITAFGSTWVNDPYPPDPTDKQATVGARQVSLIAWIMKRLNEEQPTIAEKMCLFWQNHFAVPFSGDPRATYDYHTLIYNNALGNFKQLVKDVTINPAMLVFLNGVTNNVFSPNENYAREVLELFTIGKGDQIGPGDYSNYTEDDVAAGAKIFTGYLINGFLHATATVVTPSFNPVFHDTTTKTLSYHFGNATIPDGGANEYATYIDVIFQQNEVANHICRKLYRYFVNYDLTTNVEQNVIPDMASTLIANNYDILPVMSELLASEHFYDISVRGALIRSPLDMVFALFNSTESVPGFNLSTDSEMYGFLYSLTQVMGQSYAQPPSVAGWPAYYQEPSYTQLWINSSYLKLRFQIIDIVTLFTGLPAQGDDWKPDLLAFLDNLSQPSVASLVIDDIADIFAPKGISASKKLIIKAILTNGLPDFEWTIQYNDYVNNPGDPTYSDPVRTRMELVLSRVLKMPEFHTM